MKSRQIVLFFVCTMFVSCATCRLPSSDVLEQHFQKIEGPETGFQDGLTYCAEEILYQLSRCCRSRIRQKTVGITPFIVGETGHGLKFQKDIEALIARTFKGCLKIKTLKQERSPDYVLEGVIFHEKQPGSDSESRPHLYLSVVNMKTGIIQAAADALFTELNVTPDDMDIEDPVLGPDTSQKSLIKVVRMKPGEIVPGIYPELVDLRRYVDFGDAFFHEEQYDQAISYYMKALLKRDVLGEAGVERVYEKLYQAYNRKGDRATALSYRRKRIMVRMEVMKQIDIELHFKVDSDQFLDSERQQSEFLIESITEYTRQHPVCLAIIGHSSKTGNVWYNCEVSRMRARIVREMMVRIFPELASRTLIRGRSFLKCRSCRGEDVPDRRVEFSVVECDPETWNRLNDCESAAKHAGYAR